MKNIFYKLYVVGFMILTVFFIVIIWKVTFAHVIEEYHNRKKSIEVAEMIKQKVRDRGKSTFQKLILEGEETVKYYLGYRVLEEKRIKGHFHHIGLDIGPDNRVYCIKCHGDMPHDDIKELRAFLNMHAFFLSCQTCHVTGDPAKNIVEYRWYDRRTGEIVESPVEKQKPGTYTSKIIPYENVNGRIEPIDNEERRNFVMEYKEREKSLTEAQKTRAKKMIHQIVGKQPHICGDCHQQEKPLLDLKALGYPEERVTSILSTEVVGLINNYTKFYIPRMLHPGESGNGKPGEKEKRQDQKIKRS